MATTTNPRAQRRSTLTTLRKEADRVKRNLELFKRIHRLKRSEIMSSIRHAHGLCTRIVRYSCDHSRYQTAGGKLYHQVSNAEVAMLRLLVVRLGGLTDFEAITLWEQVTNTEHIIN